MKNWGKLALTLALLFNVFAAGTHAATPTKNLDKVAVIVNNGVILESEISNTLRSVKQSARRAGQQLPDNATLRSQITEKLIMDNILQQIAEEQGMSIPDEQVDAAIADIAHQNGISVSQLRQYIQMDGVKFSDYRDQFRKDMLISEVRNSEVRRRVNILPKEVDLLAKQMKNYQENQREYNLSHIMLALPKNASVEQAKKIEEQANILVKRLKNGDNFAKAAATYSADPSALQGGAMGWSKTEELPGPFARALDKSQKGFITDPIRSRVGFHILKVNDLRIPKQQKIMATEVHARHILIKPSVILPDAEAKTKAQSLLNEIRSSSISFEQAARLNSNDPGSSTQGGDLGWANPDIFDPGFRKALLSLKKGQISAPVKSAFGWHIIQLLDSRQIDATEETYKEQANRMILNRKFSEEVQVWLQEIRATAYVKLMNSSAS